MKLLVLLVVQLLCLLSFGAVQTVFSAPSAFVPHSAAAKAKKSSAVSKMAAVDHGTNFCDLPGDPSLILTTNVDLGDKKMDIMKACSKAIQSATGKPESYIAVCINDKGSVIFGGTDDPTALGCLYSIGAIAQESNGAIQAAVTDLLEPFGVSESRIYINFFDMPRANVGWSRRTFAG